MNNIKTNSNKQFKALESLIEKTWGLTTSPSSVIATTLQKRILKRVWVKNIVTSKLLDSIILLVYATSGNCFKIELAFNSKGILCRSNLENGWGLK